LTRGVRPHRVTSLAGLIAIAGLAVTSVSCSSEPELALTVPAKEGKALYDTNGCAACHGSNGSGGVGPALVGIAGNNISLSDGSSVIADRAYLIESILLPQAQLVDGYSIKMPQNQLSEAQADLVAQFIEELPSP
jgi:mono/diheme cytochrome c family protein